MATEKAEFQIWLDDVHFNRGMDRARGKVSSLGESVNKAGANIGAAATTVSGLNSALGGTVSTTNTLVGAAGNLATTFAAGGIVAVGIAAVTTGIGYLAESMDKAAKNAEEMERKAREASEKGLAELEKRATSVSQRIDVLLGVDPLEAQAERNRVELQKERTTLKKAEADAAKALREFSSAQADADEKRFFAEAKAANKRAEDSRGRIDFLEQEKESLRIIVKLEEERARERERQERLAKWKAEQEKRKAVLRDAEGLRDGDTITSAWLAGVTDEAKAHGREQAQKSKTAREEHIRGLIEERRKGEKKAQEEMRKAILDGARETQRQLEELEKYQFDKKMEGADLEILLEMHKQERLRQIKEGATVEDLQRLDKLADAIKEKQSEIGDFASGVAAASAMVGEQLIAGLIRGQEDMHLVALNLVAQQVGAFVVGEGVKTLGVAAGKAAAGDFGGAALAAAGGAAIVAGGLAIKAGGYAAMEASAGGGVFGGGGASVPGPGGASSSGGAAPFRGGGGGDGGGLTIVVNNGIGMSSEDTQRAVLGAMREGQRRGF